MRRVVVPGRGGTGKSVLARRIGEVTGLPVTELDELFWSADLQATPRPRWEDTQRALTTAEIWVLDGDLGPYDSLQHRLAAADTVITSWTSASPAARGGRCAGPGSEPTSGGASSAGGVIADWRRSPPSNGGPPALACTF